MLHSQHIGSPLKVFNLLFHKTPHQVVRLYVAMLKYKILTKLHLDAKAELLSKRAKNHASSNGITTDQVNVKPLVKHVLSKELQMYFERITEAVLSEDERLQSQAFESLRSDPGLHQLLPYFVQHIHKKVTQNHKNLDVLEAMLSMAFSLLNNKHLFVEPYVCKLHYITKTTN